MGTREPHCTAYSPDAMSASTSMKQPLVCSGPPDDDTNARVAVAPCGLSLTALKVLNLISFVVTIALNGLSSAGVLSKYDVGAISDKYPSKIAPAGPAFSIWGPIYCCRPRSSSTCCAAGLQRTTLSCSAKLACGLLGPAHATVFGSSRSCMAPTWLCGCLQYCCLPFSAAC